MFGKLGTTQENQKNDRAAKRFMAKRDSLNKKLEMLLSKHVDEDGNIDMRHYPEIKQVENQRDKANSLALRYLLKGRIVWLGRV